MLKGPTIPKGLEVINAMTLTFQPFTELQSYGKKTGSQNVLQTEGTASCYGRASSGNLNVNFTALCYGGIGLLWLASPMGLAVLWHLPLPCALLEGKAIPLPCYPPEGQTGSSPPSPAPSLQHSCHCQPLQKTHPVLLLNSPGLLFQPLTLLVKRTAALYQ